MFRLIHLFSKEKYAHNFKNNLLIYIKEHQTKGKIRTERQRERDHSMCCFTPQMATTARLGQADIRIRDSFWSPRWMAGAQALGSSPAPFQSTSLGSWIRSQAV